MERRDEKVYTGTGWPGACVGASVLGHTHGTKDDRRVKGIEEKRAAARGWCRIKGGAERGGTGGETEGERGRKRKRVHANMLYAQARSLVTAQ